VTNGTGTKEDPWQLKTPPGTSEYTMYRNDSLDPPLIICQVDSTKLTYLARAIYNLHAMLKGHGDWMDLGAADEQKPVTPGTVEPGPAPRTTRWAAGRTAQGLSRPLRNVHAAAHVSARVGRADARGARQQDAGDLAAKFLTIARPAAFTPQTLRVSWLR
jgi:hypothetical protein